MYHLVEIVPKFSSGISIGGSLAVIQDVLLDPSKRQTTYHRLVLGISVSDVLSSTVFLISSWIKPTDNIPSKACQSFGFVGQLGNLGATLYNVVLMTYYLLMLKFRWNTLQLKNIEPFLHGFAIITTTTVAILGAVKGIYAYFYYVCWIGPDVHQFYKYAFIFVPVWVSLIYMIGAMSVAYFATRKSESKSKLRKYMKWGNNKDNEKDGDKVNIPDELEIANIYEQQMKENKARRIMIHAFMYLGAYLITWTFASIIRILELFVDQPQLQLLITSTFFTPLQGLFNSLIYFRYKIARCFDRTRSDCDEDYMEATKGRKEEDDGGNGSGQDLEGQGSSDQQGFNFNEWIAGRDNTGLGGLHFEESGEDIATNDDDMIKTINPMLEDTLEIEPGIVSGDANENESSDHQPQDTTTN